MATTREGGTGFDWMTCDDPSPLVYRYLADASERKKRLALKACLDCYPQSECDESQYPDIHSCFENHFSCKCSYCAVESRERTRCDILREIFPPPRSCPKCGLPVIKPELLGHDLENHACCQNEICEFISDELYHDWIKYPFPAEWRTITVVGIARQIDDTGDFSAMPILADALEEAGCEDAAILNHCRSGGPHLRGCWVIDLILGRE